MSKEQGAQVAGAFWSLSPVAAITSSWEGEVNAQIATALVTASIVHSVPRLLIGIWKRNYTHDFIINSKALTVHLLRRDQFGLVRKFGFFTGREKDKLGDVDFKEGVTGSPVLEDVHSFAECEVINAMDGGDMTAFLVNVVDGGVKSRDNWMTLNDFYSDAPEEWIAEYGKRLSESVAFSLERIHDIDYSPWDP